MLTPLVDVVFTDALFICISGAGIASAAGIAGLGTLGAGATFCAGIACVGIPYPSPLGTGPIGGIALDTGTLLISGMSAGANGKVGVVIFVFCMPLSISLFYHKPFTFITITMPNRSPPGLLLPSS